MCFAESGPGGKHIDFATYTRMVDRYVELEGVADVLQLSGGEPTLHPDLVRMVRYAYEQPIQAVMINTNGIRLAHDPALVEAAGADARPAGNLPAVRRLRRPHAHARCAARSCWRRSWPPWKCCASTTSAARWSARSTTTPTCTRSGAVLQLRPGAAGRPRRQLPAGHLLRPAPRSRATWRQRATMPDVVKALVAQTDGLRRRERFLSAAVRPSELPHDGYLYRGGDAPVPINRIIDVTQAHGPDRQQHRLHAGAGPAAGRRATWRAPAAAAAGRAAAAPADQTAARRVRRQGAGREARAAPTSSASR